MTSQDGSLLTLAGSRPPAPQSPPLPGLLAIPSATVLSFVAGQQIAFVAWIALTQSESYQIKPGQQQGHGGGGASTQTEKDRP